MSASIAMDNSFMIVEDWKRERYKGKVQISKQNHALRWCPPQQGSLKINVDASFHKDSPTFVVGMVLRDHAGIFLSGKNLAFVSPTSVLETEAI